jgi:hypothetical protein
MDSRPSTYIATGQEALEALLDTTGASAFLRALGIPRSPATLTRQRCVGGLAPPFRKIGRAVRYHPADLREWAEAVLSPPRRTTTHSGQVSRGGE